MGLVAQIIGRISSTAFAVDASLRVVAWNQAAEAGLRLAAAEAIGRLCYEVVPAEDVETGRPCHESCPLVQNSAHYGWAYNRVLKAPWAGGKRIRLDCFLLRCLVPTAERGNICFVGPPTSSDVETHSRVLEAVESIYPVVSGPADLQHALAVFVGTVMRAAGADGGELFLVDQDSRALLLVESQGLPAESLREFCRRTIGEGFDEMVSRAEVPLLAVGAAPAPDSAGGPAWYLSAPLVAESRVLGALSIVSQRPDFDVAAAMRIMFPVAVELTTYLRWAYLVGERRQRAGEVSPGGEASLRIYCLGGFRAFLKGKPLGTATFHRAKALALLKFLAANRGKPITRDALMDFLWPEADPARASGNLRVVLHALRHGIEEGRARGSTSLIVSEGDLVYLDPSSRVWVDAEEFSERAKRAVRYSSQGRPDDALTECREAVALYRGDFLEDEPYSDWCAFQRERLKEMLLTVLRQMAAILERQGDLAGAVEAHRTALGVDQAREELHREMMRLLLQAGRRDEALRQYEVCRRVLRLEVDAEPAESTKALYRAAVGNAADNKRN